MKGACPGAESSKEKTTPAVNNACLSRCNEILVIAFSLAGLPGNVPTARNTQRSVARVIDD
jgi:hypothetical protein